MNVKKLLASFLAVCILLGAIPETVAMAESLDTGSAITHQHTDSCYRIKRNCIHTHTEECFPPAEDNPDAASPSSAEQLQPDNCSHVCSEETGCIVKVLDCSYVMEEVPQDSVPDDAKEPTPETLPEILPETLPETAPEILPEATPGNATPPTSSRQNVSVQRNVLRSF